MGTAARLLAFGVLAIGAGGAVAANTEMKRVAGKVVRTAQICGGGAAITREQIARLPPPQPIAGMTFLVVAGAKVSAAPPAARFTTRADGTFVTQLPRGRWCFFAAGRERDVRPQRAAPTRGNVDPDCVAAEKRRCDLALTLKSDVGRAEISFPERCPQPWNQPCYRGPAPP